MSSSAISYVMQVAQRDAMQSALNANRALQAQLEMVRDQIDKLMQDNEKHIASITQLRVNPSMHILLSDLY